MVVGVLRLSLAIPGNDSLKGKRAIVKKIIERARVRFHVAAAEVADLDQHRRATLGFSVVSNDAQHAGSVIDHVVSFVAGATEALVVDRRSEVLHFGEELGVELRTLADVGRASSRALGDDDV